MSRTQRAADAVVETLVQSGVRYIFTLSGNQIMSLFDAAMDSPIQLVHVRHEAAAVHMADAWGRLTGAPGLALVTAGPGFANCLSALYVAKMAESPMVLVSGHAPIQELSRGTFQAMAQSDMAADVTKASWTVQPNDDIEQAVARAWQLAIGGRPGPVHVSIPVDVLEATTQRRQAAAHGAPFVADASSGSTAGAIRAFNDDAAAARTIVEAMSGASRPLVLCGPAVMRTAVPAQLEQATGVPVIGMESPRGVNDPSLGAFAEVLAQADMLLLLGKKIDFTLRLHNELAFASSCRLLQVDAERESVELTRRVVSDSSQVVLAVVAEPVQVGTHLASLANNSSRRHQRWREEVRRAVSFRPSQWQDLDTTSLHPVQVCREVNDFLAEADQSVFVCDGGEFGQWAQACIRGTHRVINGPSGSIGSVIPFAIAARVAFPNARIAATCGDGTFGFHAAEFDTATRYGLPFTLVVGNDARWNAEHQIQLRTFGADRTTSCDLLPTRYEQVAVALGGHGEHVTQIADLRAALERAEVSQLPACVNVMIDGPAAPVLRRK